MSSKKKHEAFLQLVEEISDHLNEAWPLVLRDWQQQVREMEYEKLLESSLGRLALVTRQCGQCGIEGRLGQIVINERMLAGRAFCRPCRQVCDGQITDIEYLPWPRMNRTSEPS